MMNGTLIETLEETVARLMNGEDELEYEIRMADNAPQHIDTHQSNTSTNINIQSNPQFDSYRSIEQ